VNGMQAKRAAVLVVEDNREMLREICRSLQARGYHAEGVTTGREALAELQRTDFAAVVADVGLARTYDLDLPREVQRLEGFRPWAMYTGAPNPLAARGCGPSGVFCILVKGAPTKKLLWSIEEACRTSSRVGQARCA